MKFIIMCGGEYKQWETPRHLTDIKGETIIARTIRLLRENGVEDISISSNNPVFEQFGVPVLKHQNDYVAYEYDKCESYWCDGFYPTFEPTCYLFGDVVFSENAIKTIVDTWTENIEFFASAPPFNKNYSKKWAEPFALKVVDTDRFWKSIKLCKEYADRGCFKREPIMWELWQVIKGTPLNLINYENYVVINDWTCDIDNPEDVKTIEKVMQ